MRRFRLRSLPVRFSTVSASKVVSCLAGFDGGTSDGSDRMSAGNVVGGAIGGPIGAAVGGAVEGVLGVGQQGASQAFQQALGQFALGIFQDQEDSMRELEKEDNQDQDA
jgi:hypothetical protein